MKHGISTTKASTVGKVEARALVIIVPLADSIDASIIPGVLSSSNL